MNNSASLEDQESKSSNKEEEEEEEEEEEDDDEYQEEDAISLCDMAVNSDQPERNSDPFKSHHHHRRSSSQPSEYSFEFSSDLIAEYTSHADDLIHCGKLVPMPYREQPRFDDQILNSLSEDYDSDNFSRRYCDSLPELKPARSRSSGAATKFTRSSRSFDRKKLRRNSSLVMKSEASDTHRSLSKGLAKSEASRPRWYGLMFGSVKLPAEMDLRDMKNRQVRRNPGSMFPGGESPANRSDRRSSWGHDLLKVLSCKNHQSSVAVTESIGLVPQL